MMTAPETRADGALDARIRTTSVIVLALSSSVVAIAAIGTAAARSMSGTPNPALTVAMVSAAFFALVGSVLYRRFNYQPIRLRQVYADSEDSGLAEHMLRTTIVSAALAEIVAVFGLMLGILSGDTYYLYALCAIALIGVLSNFPRARRWRELSSEIATHSAAEVTSGSFQGGSAG